MSKSMSDHAEPIAVVGVGATFPGRGDTAGFWRDIFDGVDTVTEVPGTHWRPEDYYADDPEAPDRVYSQRGAFLSPKPFDPTKFGTPPAILTSTDTSQLLALKVASDLLTEVEQANNGKIDRARTSVILGVASATELVGHMAGRLQRPVWEKAMREAGLAEPDIQRLSAGIASHFVEWQESTFPGLLGNVVAGRIANRLDLGGSNYVTDAACASSLSALQIALYELQAGSSDLVLTGGVDTLNDILMYMCFAKTQALSATGDCRPFSADADGTVLGEGIGLIALRRLADAERDGDRIHAVIRGLGGGSDGRATAIYAPLASGQARTLRRAYEQADYAPQTVELVEAHGTGTVAGDQAEIEGLKDVFANGHSVETPWCALGSIKSQIGHTKAAAGAAGLIKIINALSRKVLPPTIKVDRPTETLGAGTPFYLNTRSRPWIRDDKHPRRASVSSFGFGGSNFHATLEEYTGPNAATPARLLPADLFLFSAPNPDGLIEQADAVSAACQGEATLPTAADACRRRFSVSAPCRAAFLAADPHDLIAKIAELKSCLGSANGGQPSSRDVHVRFGGRQSGGTALVFAGQGSQYVGMGAELAMAFPDARRVWDWAASGSVSGDIRLDQLAFPPAPFSEGESKAQDRRLTAVDHAQPTIAMVALVQLALLDKIGVNADMAAGHSFGEVIALHAAGVFDRATALSIALLRGQLMAKAAASHEGGMLAIQAAADDVRRVLDELQVDVVLANDNAPEQTVLSGPLPAIGHASTAFAGRGFVTRRLPVASAFHSAAMADARAPFLEALRGQRLAKPKIDVYANSTGMPYPKTPSAIRKRLAEQILKPVLFRDSIEAMHEAGARTFIEVGPGSVVSTLIRSILQDRDVRIFSLDHRQKNEAACFLSAVGALLVDGHAIDLEALFADLPVPLPPENRSPYAVDICGANYGKPYPPSGGADATLRVMTEQDQDSTDCRDQRPQRLEMTHMSKSNHSASSESLPVSSQPSPPLARRNGGRPETNIDHIWQEISLRHSEFLTNVTAAHTTFLNAASNLLGASNPSLTTSSQPLHESPVLTPQAEAPVIQDARAETERATMPAPPIAPDSTPSVNGSGSGRPDAAMIRSLIAEKTGYPPEMLEDDMDLEGELGVDSIKQVEILSALRERFPDLPEIEPHMLADMRTIRKIADFFA
ncbi:MAG: beta-ketoacyl synthase N-terminal-like domain-containing protein [Geminicoccaceae bacterium]